jgi:hypothetical protein
MYIPPKDPISDRVDDLVSLALAMKETTGVDLQATACLSSAMVAVLTELHRITTPAAELHVINGGKH